MPYLDAIDGHGQEDLFYGFEADDQHSPQEEIDYLKDFLDRSKDEGKVILVTDYCSTQEKMTDSYNQNSLSGYISFAADHRALDNIPVFPPVIHQENNLEITQLSEVENFLYLINVVNYQSKEEFISAVAATNYDLLIMDLFFEDNTACTPDEIERLRAKANGGKRMILCYMSIGEAEDYRYYWKDSWKPGNPSWMGAENPDWEGNYEVRYWEPEWQDIITGNDGSYLKKIIDAGFDGAYLDIIYAYEYFE
jgi:cysteinyl-tRNA synthetase